MSVARVSEITSMSPTSFEAAIKEGIDRATSTLRHVRSAWISEQEVRVENDQIVGYEVTMKVVFMLEDSQDMA